MEISNIRYIELNEEKYILGDVIYNKSSVKEGNLYTITTPSPPVLHKLYISDGICYHNTILWWNGDQYHGVIENTGGVIYLQYMNILISNCLNKLSQYEKHKIC